MIKKNQKKNNKNLNLGKSLEKANYIFLGIGLSLFLINITSFMLFVKTPNYDYTWFDVSILSSVIIVIVATYNIFHNE